jgi:hypothetical protein
MSTRRSLKSSVAALAAGLALGGATVGFANASPIHSSPPPQRHSSPPVHNPPPRVSVPAVRVQPAPARVNSPRPVVHNPPPVQHAPPAAASAPNINLMPKFSPQPPSGEVIFPPNVPPVTVSQPKTMGVMVPTPAGGLLGVGMHTTNGGTTFYGNVKNEPASKSTEANVGAAVPMPESKK